MKKANYKDMNINELIAFIHERGGFHDSVINDLTWGVSERVLKIFLEDGNSNFLGLPEYAGREPLVIIASEVVDLSLEVAEVKRCLRVFDFDVFMESDFIKSVIKLYPFGSLNLLSGSLHFERIDP